MTDDASQLLPLVRSRMRLLPAPREIEEREVAGKEREAIVEAFVASPEAAGLPDAGGARGWPRISSITPVTSIMTTDLVPTLDFSPAKAHLSDVVTGVFHQHRPTLVSRHHGKEQVVLVRVDDLLAMLPSAPFDVEVVYDPSSVAVAVPEMGVLGVGDTLDLAIDDLVAEMRAYAKRFFADPLRYFAAGQGARAGRLLAFALARDDAQRHMLLGADAPSAEVEQTRVSA